MPEKEFLILVNFRDFDPDPYYNTYAHWVLSLSLWGNFAEFRAKAIDIAGPRLHHTETSKFKLWPRLDPTDEVNLKTLSMLWGDLVRAFEGRLVGIDTTIGSQDSGGGGRVRPAPGGPWLGYSRKLDFRPLSTEPPEVNFYTLVTWPLTSAYQLSGGVAGFSRPHNLSAQLCTTPLHCETIKTWS